MLLPAVFAHSFSLGFHARCTARRQLQLHALRLRGETGDLVLALHHFVVDHRSGGERAGFGVPKLGLDFGVGAGAAGTAYSRPHFLFEIGLILLLLCAAQGGRGRGEVYVMRRGKRWDVDGTVRRVSAHRHR
jgi:hypothetical protein